MTYGNVTGQLIQMILAEYLNHKSGAFMQMHTLVVNADYSATLLTAVLKAVQRIIGILCGILNAVNAKHSAFVMNLFHMDLFYCY